MQNKLTPFYQKLHRLYTLGSISSLLGWDQQVNLPKLAGDGRSEQLELMSALSHAEFTHPEFAALVDDLAQIQETLSANDRINVRETKRQLDRARKLPTEFVAEQAKASTIGYQVWSEARGKNDWQAVLPKLQHLVDLARREADLLGYEDHPYDALFDGYEPGGRIKEIQPLLLRLGEALSKMLPTLTARFADTPSPSGDYPEEVQQRFNSFLASKIGYDFERGRLDSTHHPFMTNLGVSDIRITTHYYRNDYLSSVYSTLHETGHALYELGFLPQHKGTPMGSAVSLGIHESQSRFWENLIGRSHAYCEFLHRALTEYFPAEARSLSPSVLWKMVNKVQPSLIRIEADEVSYSLHIIIRMLLEAQLVAGSLAVKDLPEAWNALYEKYLGIRPPDNRDGVMQDVHWYSGSIGYFPTYALGNLYGAMMLEALEQAQPDLWDRVRQGDCSNILRWLRTNVHELGMTFSGPQLIQRISGRSLSEEAFVRYLDKKFFAVMPQTA
jgi:carboxypeptidase Taq